MSDQSRQISPVLQLQARLSARPETRYSVVIGAGALSRLPELLPADRYGVVVISEQRVWPLWGEAVMALLAERELRVGHYLFAPGEVHKSRETKATLEDRLLADAWGRDVVLVALGGGVVTDLVGYLAATYLRGVRYLSVPTTLLAMVDAALGGKTGVNTAAGKNLVGAFHQPEAVLADLDTLGTLPDVELDHGLAETVKHAALADEALLDRLVTDATALRARDAEVLGDIVARSMAVKLQLVAADEQDHGVRQALNFGHTVGHALERASDYRVGHGHAVAVGMCVESDAAVRAGLMAPTVRDRIVGVIESLGLPARVPEDISHTALTAALVLDKKNRGGEVRYAFPGALGQVATFGGHYTTALPDAAVRDALESHRGEGHRGEGYK
jgi:3-dehydroquinate synthase